MSRPDDPRLRTELAGLDLRNPIILAAGTAGLCDELSDVLDLSKVGAIVTKSITREPRIGNETWRIVPSKAGLLNAIGLANPGIDRFVAEVAPRLGDVPSVVIGSIAGTHIEDYAHVARAMDAIEHLPAIELNVSCPNVHGGTEFGTDPEALDLLVRTVRAELGRTKMIVKLSPIAVGQPGMVEVARAAIESGADALSIANTTPAMGIDVRTRRPVLANISGGLSGPAVHPVAVKLVYDVYRGIAREAGVPIVGVGGVSSWDDAAELILAGASAVQLGTILFADPRAPIAVTRGLSRWLGSLRLGTIAGAIGQVLDER